jgi:glucose/arabinose dehydrogenase/mono/diheme cytochrome c family protein
LALFRAPDEPRPDVCPLRPRGASGFDPLPFSDAISFLRAASLGGFVVPAARIGMQRAKNEPRTIVGRCWVSPSWRVWSCRIRAFHRKNHRRHGLSRSAEPAAEDGSGGRRNVVKLRGSNQVDQPRMRSISWTRRAAALGLAALLASLAGLAAQPQGSAPRRPPADPGLAEWIEPDFPFFSSVLDARKTGVGSSRNLTPRGLVLRLGRGYWAAFDIDLLRVAALWQGNAVTPKALAPGSYHAPDRKTALGQSPLPEPDGQVWLTNGIYPGWQAGARPALTDPREPAPTAEEIGRGPVSEDVGRFTALRQVSDGVVLEYTAGGTAVREWITATDRDGRAVLERHFALAPAKQALWLILGFTAPGTSVALCNVAGVNTAIETIDTPEGTVRAVRIPEHAAPIQFCAAVARGDEAPPVSVRVMPSGTPASRWRHEVVTKITPSTAKAAYVVDDVALPAHNPWKRGVRPGDIQFLSDGTGAMVTLDGDVWLVRGFAGDGGPLRWRRFASGLHEPLTLAIRDEQIHVFDRNGIWKLRDTNDDGEADVHELFSNAFAQNADTREFPNTLRLGPRGEFVIAKGGQESTTLGKHNGSVLRISADGRQATVLGYGFRQPNIGVNPRNGLVTASDQQGHYIPSTPLHIVRDRQFYGFLSDKRPREVYPAPIADPLTWIPHPVNASAMSQVWLFGARLGPLNDSLVHIGYNRPELFRVLVDERAAKPQAAVVSITRAFDYPPLNGSVNPADGHLYIAGFQILGWGTTATRMAGLGRVRHSGMPSTVPSAVLPTDKGVLLRFDVPLNPERAADPGSFSVTSWHYQRTFKYGSPQLKADGTPGVDQHPVSRAYVSTDQRSVFVAVPGMKPVMQMQVGWSLATESGQKFQDYAFFTPYELPPFRPSSAGFGDLEVDLSARPSAAAASGPVTVDEGKRLAQLYGCTACHATDDVAISRLGPTWRRLYGSERRVANPERPVLADDAYLRESILEPTAKIAVGFEKGEAGMPSYAGVLTPEQIDAIILYIQTLK